jgi:hypothetical protein
MLRNQISHVLIRRWSVTLIDLQIENVCKRSYSMVEAVAVWWDINSVQQCIMLGTWNFLWKQ